MAQELVVRHIKGAEVDEGGTDYEIACGAEFASQYTKSFQVITDPTLRTMGQVWLRLKNNNPMITTGSKARGENVGHAIVVMGYSYGKIQEYVIYCDPRSGSINTKPFERYKDGSATGFLWENTIRK